MEKNLINFLLRKLSAKEYTLRIVAIFIGGLIFSKLLVTALTTESTGWIPFFNHAYFASIIISALSLINLVLSGIFCVGRVRDIVTEVPVWPYAVAVLLIGFIPLIGFLMYVLLMFIPSGYLNEAKRGEIVARFA